MNFTTKKIRKIQQRLTYLLKNSAFFMQGQMDIHPSSRWYNLPFVKQTGGFFPTGGAENHRSIKSLEPWDNTRRDMIVLLLRTICEHGIPGDFVELGTYKGYTARLIHQYAPERRLHIFDTFDGFPEKSMTADKELVNNPISRKLFTDTSVDKVKGVVDSRNDNVYYYKGYFPESIPETFKSNTFAFVHLDADLYLPVKDGLEFFYERMNKGSFILIHDYNAWIGARKAVDEFFKSKPEIPIPMPDKSGSVLIQKQ